MSHTVTVRTEVRNEEAVRRACRRLGLEQPTRGKTHLSSSGEHEGTLVRLRDWQYPVVAKTETGELFYDNYNGLWGDQARLDEFLQGYGVEAAKMAAEEQGYQVAEEQLANGDVRLLVTVGY